ncbi:hypothetical protein INR49_018533 [Caranx melampygus]|nr:hypothetical protein INR49_018533 [Caranx melampygus]
MDNISSHKHFTLDGFSELGSLRPILFIPFSIMFILSLTANSLLLYVIISQRSLHSPMYILIASMACVDLSLPLFFVPHMLLSFLFDWRGISLTGCLVQMHFIHFIGTFMSTILLWMALDCYFAICTPLQYHEQMAPQKFLRFMILPVLRNVILITALVVLAGSLSYCGPNVINHCFCEHMALVELACGSTKINSLLGLMTVFLIPVADFIIITASYVVIFRSVLKSGKAGVKALDTCITHIVVISITLTVALIAFLSYRIRSGLPSASRVFSSTMYLLFPSCFNPIIYGEAGAMLQASQGRNFSHTTFVFRGFPTLHRHRQLLALPFSASFLSVLLGNSLLIHVIRCVESLQSPMYLLICTLCVVDILVVTAIIPKMLLGLLCDWDEISLAGCLSQMFFTHFLSSVESTLLLAMALDRYVAICHPLRYNEIVNSSMFLWLLVFTLLRSVSIMATLVGLAGSLWFCGSNNIQHCYCDHMALVSLACDNTEKNSTMGLAVIVCFVGVDISLIIFSYMRILIIVLRAASAGEDRWKAFHTCGTHLIVMLCFYLVGSITFLSHNLNIPIPTDVNTFMGLLYILFPATVNPIIYGFDVLLVGEDVLQVMSPPVFLRAL